jgi:phage terminase Nu1 subunit (DNA packaging protein)
MTALGPERYVNAAELSEFLGVSIRTIRRFTAQGMPCHRWGMARTVRFLPSEAIRWASTRHLVTPPEPIKEDACYPS